MMRGNHLCRSSTLAGWSKATLYFEILKKKKLPFAGDFKPQSRSQGHPWTLAGKLGGTVLSTLNAAPIKNETLKLGHVLNETTANVGNVILLLVLILVQLQTLFDSACDSRYDY